MNKGFTCILNTENGNILVNCKAEDIETAISAIYEKYKEKEIYTIYIIEGTHKVYIKEY